MSGTAIARYLLANSAGLTAVVPAARIISGSIPLNTALPAIAVTQISSMQHNNVAQSSATYLVVERVQVSVMASTYPAVKSILALVRAALPLSQGDVNGFACESIYPDVEGPDMYDDQIKVRFQSQDFMVSFCR